MFKFMDLYEPEQLFKARSRDTGWSLETIVLKILAS